MTPYDKLLAVARKWCYFRASLLSKEYNVNSPALTELLDCTQKAIDAADTSAPLLMVLCNSDAGPQAAMPQCFQNDTCLFADATQPVKEGEVVLARVIALPEELRTQLREVLRCWLFGRDDGSAQPEPDHIAEGSFVHVEFDVSDTCKPRGFFHAS